MADSKAKQDAITKSENYKIFAGFLANCMQKLFKLKLSSDIEVLKKIMNTIECLVDSFAATDKLQENNDKKEETIEPTLVTVKVEKEDMEEMSNTEIEQYIPIFEEKNIVPKVADQNIVPRVIEQNITPIHAQQNIVSRDPRVINLPTKSSTPDNSQKSTIQKTNQNNIPRPNSGNYQQYQNTFKAEIKNDHRRTPYARNIPYNHRGTQQPYNQYNYPQHQHYVHPQQQQLQQPDNMYNMQPYQMQTMPYIMNQQAPRPTQYYPH